MKIRDFRMADIERCTDIVRDMWRIDTYIHNASHGDVLNQMYAESHVYGCGYRVVLTEDDVVKGFMFCKVPDNSVANRVKDKIRSFLFKTKVFFRILFGQLGNRKEIIEFMDESEELDRKTEEYTSKYDSVIELFLIDKECRGKGYGRLMINHFIEYCKTNDIGSVCLFTDVESDFGFYDKLGFVRSHTFNDELIEPSLDGSDNCMIYTLKL